MCVCERETDIDRQTETDREKESIWNDYKKRLDRGKYKGINRKNFLKIRMRSPHPPPPEMEMALRDI